MSEILSLSNKLPSHVKLITLLDLYAPNYMLSF